MAERVSQRTRPVLAIVTKVRFVPSLESRAQAFGAARWGGLCRL